MEAEFEGLTSFLALLASVDNVKCLKYMEQLLPPPQTQQLPRGNAGKGKQSLPQPKPIPTKQDQQQQQIDQQGLFFTSILLALI